MSTARTAPHVSLPAIIDSLRQKIRRMETLARADDARVISTGCRELDQLLPAGGLASGTITEWLTPAGGQGAELLSLLAAREACADGGALVVIDPDQSFYAPAVAGWGINLDNTIVLTGAREETRGARKTPPGATAGLSSSAGLDTAGQVSSGTPSNTPAASRRAGRASPSPSRPSSLAPHSLFWAIDQALRCPAVGAVWGRLDRINQRWLRRFQLSAEQSGAAGMFVRPASVQGQPGWSEVQWLVSECGMRNTECEVARKNVPAPVKRAYQRAWQEKQNRDREKADAATFDRTIPLQLIRVRGGPQQTHRQVTVRIDFTTGKLHATVANYEPSQYSTPRIKTGVVRVAGELAHPAAGGRRQRA